MDGAAGRAGLRPTRRDQFGRVMYGDVIIAVDDQQIEENDDLIVALEQKKEGDQVIVKFVRNGKVGETTVMLQTL